MKNDNVVVLVHAGQKITKETLEGLTCLVLGLCFDGKMVEMMHSYSRYCMDRNIRASRRAHYDWATEMLENESKIHA